MKILLTLAFCSLLPSLALATPLGGGTGTPEIPAGAAPIIVAGIVGTVMLIRSRRNKPKQD
jgi:hypothetical protein